MRLGFLALGILSLTLGSAPVAFAQPELYSGLNEGEAVLKTIKDEQRLSGEGLGAATFPGHLLSGAAGVDLGPLRFEGERYWGGEAKLRVEGKKMELTEIPAEEWNQVVKDAEEFWDELASISPRTAKVVQAYKDYTAVMEKVGVPYRYG